MPVRGRGRPRGRPPLSSYNSSVTHLDVSNTSVSTSAATPTTSSAKINTPNRGRGRGRGRVTGNSGSGGAAAALSSESPKEAVTYNEAEQTVYFNVDGGGSLPLHVKSDIPIVSVEEYDRLVDSGECRAHVDHPPEPHIKLPEASVKEIKNYSICDAPARPNAYIRFIEKSAEELDGEVEYDVDEEDTMWLAMINEKRQAQGMAPVPVDSLELLMDRLEKESYFQAAANGQSGAVVDDDAVCCICMDGECQNTNVILFCDMCNLAVHQDCYGVPYIPEGQWLCRRCLQSPSRPVDCVLCPNKGGAFKQTDRNQWAHVVCALWIPEVRFANTVFLEPIDSIETIPTARWRLCCYICKQKGVGACIQCHRGNCYAAFHVTCAQQAGLHMRMDTVRDSVTGCETQPIIVQKLAYCDAHAPAHDPNDADSDNEKAREESKNKMKQARKMLAKKRTSVPVILIPTIPPDRIQQIAGHVNISKKASFIQRLIAYWTLKRHYRNGVPLLRRLQSSTHSSQKNGIEGSPDAKELYHQLKYWQSLRQDLERARLLCELVRKREKLKLVWMKMHEQHVMMEINPVDSAMRKLLDAIESKDSSEIFREPVDIEEVPDYTDIVKHPMDLSTMRSKLAAGMYYSLDDFEADFDLMIRNCLAYNNRDTMYYRAGVRMRDQCAVLFRELRQCLEEDGLIQPKKTDEIVGQEIDEEMKQVLLEAASEKALVKLQILYERAVARHGLCKTKRVRVLKAEITKMKKTILKTAPTIEIPDSATSAPTSEMVAGNSSQLLMIHSQLMTEGVTTNRSMVRETVGTSKEASNNQTPPCSPIKSSASNSASPSGVNRRTAVLFTRKAQAALKKPETPVKEEGLVGDLATLAADKSVKSAKKVGRKPGRPPRKSVEADLANSSKSNPKKSPIKDMFPETIPESFRNYRSEPKRDVPGSDESDNSFDDSSSCSSCSDCSSGSDFDSSFDDEDDDDNSMCSGLNSSDNADEDDEDEETGLAEKTPLQPLQLVWAKTRGYPWYPALIIDPDIPKGFINNGVPLPVPPSHVLEMRKSHNKDDDNAGPLFLILFFDPKRTWQWLPATKLELLGIDKALDQSKLVESKKPQDKKAVKKAYQEALHYQSQVSEAEVKNAST